MRSSIAIFAAVLVVLLLLIVVWSIREEKPTPLGPPFTPPTPLGPPFGPPTPLGPPFGPPTPLGPPFTPPTPLGPPFTPPTPLGPPFAPPTPLGPPFAPPTPLGPPFAPPTPLGPPFTPPTPLGPPFSPITPLGPPFEPVYYEIQRNFKPYVYQVNSVIINANALYNASGGKVKSSDYMAFKRNMAVVRQQTDNITSTIQSLDQNSPPNEYSAINSVFTAMESILRKEVTPLVAKMAGAKVSKNNKANFEEYVAKTQAALTGAIAKSSYIQYLASGQ